MVHKEAGKLSRLKESLGNGLPEGVMGIGHTRWATHGNPTDLNAHPHMDCQNDVVVAHNGIVENYLQLKQELIDQGHAFTSQTDTECIPHLIESYLMEEYSLEESVRKTAERMRGANSVVVMSKREPEKIIGARLGNAGGIVVGYCENVGDFGDGLASSLYNNINNLHTLHTHSRKNANSLPGDT